MHELKVEMRQILGKSVKTLRQKGLLPAVVYGEAIPTQPISVSYKEFEKVYKAAGESTLVRLKVAGTTHNVLIHDIAFDPITGHSLHADFYAVRMDKALRARVPLEFIGESAAVKNEGGILVKVAHELEVEALPQDLPHSLPVDIGSLAAFGSRILLQDIPVPHGVKILGPADEVIAVVNAPRSDEELAALKEAPPAETVAVETEREAKKAAEAKAEAAGGEESEKEK